MSFVHIISHIHRGRQKNLSGDHRFESLISQFYHHWIRAAFLLILELGYLSMNLLFECTFYFFHLIWMELFSVITTLFPPFNFLPCCILCNCKKAASDIFRCIILWIGVKRAIKIYFAQHSISEDFRLQSIQFIEILTWNAV